jgi:hypothetical protein
MIVHTRAACSTVTRGLGPRVHLLRKKYFAKSMDCRVKPGNDGEGPRFTSIYMSPITL